jgi:hypothetical protein
MANQATDKINLWWIALMIDTAFKPVDARGQKQMIALTLLRGSRGIRDIAIIPKRSLPSANGSVIFADWTTPDDPVQIPVERNLEYSFTQAPPWLATASQSYWLIEI